MLQSAISLMMVAVSTSETSVNVYQTIQHNIPEDSHFHTRRLENLKSHKLHYKLFRVLLMFRLAGAATFCTSLLV
jgi:hypothetical protein